MTPHYALASYAGRVVDSNGCKRLHSHITSGLTYPRRNTMTFEWANRRFQTLVAVYEGLRASLAPEASPIQTPDPPFPIDAGMGKHFGQENIPAINEMLSAGTWKSVPSTWWMTAWMDQLLLFALYERRREQLKSEKPEEFLLGEEDLTKGMLRVGALGADLARRYGPAGSMDDRGVSWSCVE